MNILTIVLFALSLASFLLGFYTLFSKKYRYYHTLGYFVLSVIMFFLVVVISFKQLKEHATMQISETLNSFVNKKQSANSFDDATSKQILPEGLYKDPFFVAQKDRFVFNFKQNSMSVTFQQYSLPYSEELCLSISEKLTQKNLITLNDQILEKLSPANLTMACQQKRVIFEAHY